MTIAQELEAQILSYYHAEKWRIGTIAYMLERDSASGPFYHQEWQSMKATTPIISGGMNALRLPGFFDKLGHSNVIQTSGGGTFGHRDGAIAGARSLRQAHDA